jgi:transcriptional regulator with PAS, ATPase and Fis domain
LAGLVEAGGVRRDLYHRLNEATLVLPPLRERGDDLDALADSILSQAERTTGRTLQLTAAARAALRAHDWRGNVRELENVLRRAATFAPTGGAIDAGDLKLDGALPPRTLAEVQDDATQAAVRAALRRHALDLRGAARELGIAVGELQRLCDRYRVDLGDAS